MSPYKPRACESTPGQNRAQALSRKTVSAAPGLGKDENQNHADEELGLLSVGPDALCGEESRPARANDRVEQGPA